MTDLLKKTLKVLAEKFPEKCTYIQHENQLEWAFWWNAANVSQILDEQDQFIEGKLLSIAENVLGINEWQFFLFATDERMKILTLSDVETKFQDALILALAKATEEKTGEKIV